MVGRDLDQLYPRTERSLGEPLLNVADWSVGSPLARGRMRVREVSFSVRAGEIVGVFGLIGSGASDLARSLFGAHSGRVSGRVEVRGRPVRLSSPRRARAAGLAYLPSDRKRDSLVRGMTIAANLTLAALGDFSPFGLIDRRRELRSVVEQVRALQVKCTSAEQLVDDLSGGNQQKVAAGKWMLSAPDVVVVEEPTRGVDVGAKVEIYNLLNGIAGSGRAILLVSTDLPEVLGISDRVMAMRRTHCRRMAARRSERQGGDDPGSWSTRGGSCMTDKPIAAPEALAGERDADRPTLLSGAQIRSFTMIGVLIAIWLVFHALTNGIFLTPRNLTNLSGQVAITAILACGIVMVIVPAYIDLSIGATVSFCAVIAAMTSSKFGFSAPVAIAATLAVGALMGAWHGVWVAVLRVPAFIVTLASLLAVRGYRSGHHQQRDHGAGARSACHLR